MRKLLNRNRTAQEPSLLANSHLHVAIDDLLASHALRLSFRNASDKPVEAVYTFPIPLDAAFLGMDARLAGETLSARIVPTASAQREYDDAVQEGDSAVLLEELEPGLLCVNLGNLLPNEDGTITLRFVTALSVADRQARFSLPLVHRPRYGRYHLDLLATPDPDLLTEHPLQAEIDIRGLLAETPVHCALQGTRFERKAGQTFIKLSEAMLDRDLVLTFELGDADITSTRYIQDGDNSIGVMTFVPKIREHAVASPLSLCLLMDCSGSMTGDAIMQSRTALRSVAGALQEEDRIQVLRFGSSIEPMFRRPLRSGPRVIDALEHLESTINANLGGTDMGDALDTAIDQLERLDGHVDARVIVLVTDGAVQPHDIAGASLRAEASGIRIFVVAVGSSAGVDVLGPLAQRTRGALERAVPSEPVDAGVMRHFRRARSLQPERLEVDWGGPTVDTVPLGNTYAGDAVMMVGVVPKSADRNVRIRCQGVSGEVVLALRGATQSSEWRAWAGQQLYLSANAARKPSLALQYGLICPETSAVLVKEREVPNKSAELPIVSPVRPMVPAGTLAHNTVSSGIRLYSAFGHTAASAMDSCFLESTVDVHLSEDHAYTDIPAFLRNNEVKASHQYVTGNELGLSPEQVDRAERAVLAALIVILLDDSEATFTMEVLYGHVSDEERGMVEAWVTHAFGGPLKTPHAWALLNALLQQYEVALSDAQEAALAVS